jgi:hypothetical protein
MCLSAREIVRTEHSMPTGDEFSDNTLVAGLHNFNPEAVNVLNQLLDISGAEIVISSDWKLRVSFDQMLEFYHAQGVTKSPIDSTAWLPNYSKYHKQRAHEIADWLEQHPAVSHWAAVDDLYLGSWLTNFVWAKNVHLGITDPDVQQKLQTYF